MKNSCDDKISQLNGYLAVNELLENAPEFSAKNLLRDYLNLTNFIVVLLVCLVALLFPHKIFAIFCLVMSVLYAFTLFFKTLLFLVGMASSKNKGLDDENLNINDQDLPIYTILLPLYKEQKVINKLINSLRNLDYPKEKLDIKIIVESDDEITQNAVSRFKLEDMFNVVVVPYSFPRTKPKACNYALKFAEGEFVTIYDAEDIPDKLQLKKALYQFYNSDEKLVCVQAKLNYFNYNKNWISRLFAIEYSCLFDFLLKGLQIINVPIPLGGTSNHFRMSALKELYGWDPYNVTEDAD